MRVELTVCVLAYTQTRINRNLICSRVAYYAIGRVNVNGIHSTDVTDAGGIRQRCPIRLLRPEWVSSQPDILVSWLVAETIARLGLVTAL